MSGPSTLLATDLDNEIAIREMCRREVVALDVRRSDVQARLAGGPADAVLA